MGRDDGTVALRKESVDRNMGVGTTRARRGVALRKESVDRNMVGPSAYRTSSVALRKESVDRNLYLSSFVWVSLWSLSARRAWIEISYGALEGASEITSLSARRAWIEISASSAAALLYSVALRKESVDRNKQL